MLQKFSFQIPKLFQETRKCLFQFLNLVIRFPFQFAFVFKLGPMQIMFTLAPANLKYKYNSLCVTDEIGQAALNIHLEINIHLSNSKLCPLFSTPDHKKQFVKL